MINSIGDYFGKVFGAGNISSGTERSEMFDSDLLTRNTQEYAGRVKSLRQACSVWRN